MKNRKNKIANLFKIGTFLLSFSLLLFNCEKEPELNVGLVEQHKEVIKLKTLTNSNGIIDNLLNDFENKNIIDYTKKSKTFDGYTIDNSVVKYIENIETGYHSYTFNIKERRGLNFKNLLLSYDLTTNSYKKYLVNYNLDINEIVNFYNTKQISTDKISMIEIPNSSNKSKQKVSQMKTECAVISTYDFCMEGNHPGGFDGGVRCPAFAQIVISTCEAGGSSPTGGDSTGDDIEISSGGGTGVNSSQNSTYVDATVPILSLGETIANELHNIIGLTSSEYKWLSDEKNIEETLDILSFLKTNKNPDNTYPEEATNFAKLAVKMLAENPNLSIDDIDFEDRIINLLPEKAKCVFNKLKGLNLFKATIKKFENSDRYNLIIEQNDKCKIGIDGCTDGKDVANGNIKINLRITPHGQPLNFAAALLHEGIHAELFKYVDEHQKGLDPNKRKNLLGWYFRYKGHKYQTELAQHQHMADNYVKPIAQAIRKLDNYSYPIEYYMGFGWDGLTKYGYDEYYDNGKLVSLDKSKVSEYYKKQKIVNDNTKLNGNECK